MEHIPSFSQILTPLQKPVFDDPAQQDGLKYSVPYMYGTAGIGVRTDIISTPVTSWDTMWDPANKGKITMLNAERTCIGQTLLYLGYSLNTTDPKQVDEATAKLIEQKPLVLKYEASGLPRTMASGVPLVNCYDGDAAIAKRDIGAKKLDYVLPSEGAYFWVDNLAIPKSAASPYGAHLFIEFLTKAENSAQNSTWIGYQTPNEQAFAMINGPDRAFAATDRRAVGPGRDRHGPGRVRDVLRAGVGEGEERLTRRCRAAVRGGGREGAGRGEPGRARPAPRPRARHRRARRALSPPGRGERATAVAGAEHPA